MTIECIKGGYYSSGCGLGGVSEESPVRFFIDDTKVEAPITDPSFNFQTNNTEDASVTLNMLNGNDSGAGIRTIADNVGNFDRLELFAKDDTINGEQILSTFTKTQIDFSLPINADTITATNLSAANFSPTTITATDINTINLTTDNFTLNNSASISGTLTVSDKTTCNQGIYVSGTYQNDSRSQPISLYVNGKGYIDGLYVDSYYRTTGGSYTKLRKDPGAFSAAVVDEIQNNDYPLEVNGKIKASEFHAYSSITKKDIVARESEFAAELSSKFDAIDFVKYKYKDTIFYGTNEYYGYIAEELAAQFPELVDQTATDIIPNIYADGTVKADDAGLYKQIVLPTPFSGEIHGQDIVVYKENPEEQCICVAESIDETNTIITLKEPMPHIDSEQTVFVYGTRELCPTVSKSNVVDMLCARVGILVNQVNALTARIEVLENPTRKRAKKK